LTRSIPLLEGVLMPQDGPPPLLGIREAAEMIGVTYETLGVWKARGKFVEPDWILSGSPVWKPATIRKWGRETGRLNADGEFVQLPSGRPRKAKP
jgi:hypothetical protein